MLLLYTHCLYARAPSLFLYTLIGSLSDDHEFARSDWIFYSIVQVFDETVHDCEELESLSTYSGIHIPLIFSVIFWFSLYHYQLSSISLLIYYHVWILICDIAVIIIYYSLDL